MKEILKVIVINVRFTAALLLMCSVVYPALIWTAGALTFRVHADGSLIRRDGQVVGSRFIGQQFASPAYFHGRPSATNPAYNAAMSGASNYAPTNPALFARMADELTSAAELDRLTAQTIASDRIYASGSGLDPDISPENAAQQTDRVARDRGLDRAAVAALVVKHTQSPLLGFIGTRTVNVLSLNLELDQVAQRK
jgi:potassium-transporting ATPase KdpC subunit